MISVRPIAAKSVRAFPVKPRSRNKIVMSLLSFRCHKRWLFAAARFRVRYGSGEFLAISFLTKLLAAAPVEKLHIAADCAVDDQLISLARDQRHGSCGNVACCGYDIDIGSGEAVDEGQIQA